MESYQLRPAQADGEKETLEKGHVTSRIPYATGPEHQSCFTGAGVY